MPPQTRSMTRLKRQQVYRSPSPPPPPPKRKLKRKPRKQSPTPLPDYEDEDERDEQISPLTMKSTRNKNQKRNENTPHQASPIPSLPDYEDYSSPTPEKPPKKNQQPSPNSRRRSQAQAQEKASLNPTLHKHNHRAKFQQRKEVTKRSKGGVDPSAPRPEMDHEALHEARRRKRDWNTKQAERDRVADRLETVRWDIEAAEQKAMRMWRAAERRVERRKGGGIGNGNGSGSDGSDGRAEQGEES